MTLWEAILLAIVEGLTEFLPVSSTGHMIIVSSLLGINDDAYTKFFEIAIQFGAILSVVVLYWKRFFKSIDFYFKLTIGFVPAGVLGFLFDDIIDAALSSPLVVAVNLLIGGVLFLFVDRWFNKPYLAEKEPDFFTSFKIGAFQAIAMLPGVSRSAATIIGGQINGLNRKAAAEFSFFLAVPTMFAATAYKTYKNIDLLGSVDLSTLLIGNIVAFIVAALAMKGFVTYLTRHGFKVFGYYRIILGLIIIGLAIAGIPLKVN